MAHSSITHGHHPDRLKGILCVLFSIVVWSGWIIISRHSVTGTLSAFDITALRFGVAGVLLFPVLLRKGLNVGPWGWKSGLFLALAMGAPYNTIAIAGMKFAPASHAAIINTMMLIVTSIASIVILREATTRVRIIGITLSIVGIIIMLYAGHASEGGKEWLGHLLFIIGGSMWACYAIAVRAWKLDALHATASVCVWSCVLYMPIYLLFIPSHISSANMHEALFQAVYQGTLNSILALLCFNRGIAILGAATASAFLPLIPVLATLGAIPLLGEVPGITEWTGIAVASGGVFLSTGIATRLYIRYVQKPLGS